MTALVSKLEWLHGRIGWLGTSLLFVPILGWVWLAAQGPVISVFSGHVPVYVLSGKLFAERFDTIHAGSALDQPTIGKWLFWFTVMTVSSLPYVVVVGWLANRSSRSGRFAFAIGASIVSVFLLCILSWPLTMLVQYVWSMGFTPRRVYGLAYAAGNGLLVLGCVGWVWLRPRMADG